MIKKILLFLFINLFWFNISFADLYDLKINLNTSETITEKIKIKNGYSSKCSVALEDSNEKGLLSLNTDGYRDRVNILIALELKEGNDSGLISFEYSAKINQDGSLGKKKILNNQFSGSSNFKKEMKPYVNVFKNMGDLMFHSDGYYPDYGKPLTRTPKIIDGKKLFRKMINLVAKSVPKQSGQLKKMGSHVIKNSDINVIKEFIGYSEINGERFNLIRYKFKINYNGNKSEYRSFLSGFNIDQIAFFHESGLPTVVYDIIPSDDTWMNHSMVCNIFKDNFLISEISIPMLKDASQLKKKTKKNLNLEKEGIIEKIEKLNDLYKSGVLTEEEFKKAKERILN